MNKFSHKVKNSINIIRNLLPLMTLMEPQNKSDSMVDKEMGSTLSTVSPH
jgi:hypothetical protein